jgi:hypothetical protein
MLSMIFLLATAPAPPSQAAQDPIVVVGQRINEARNRLDACIARRCPPNEEIDAALALAETQLVSGEYRDARSTLLRSLSRNKDEAKRYPIPVSDLYRANGKVAAHLGFDRDYYRSTWGIYRTMKLGLPSAEDRKFSALMEVAEMTYRTRGHERARLYYDSIAKQAREAGRPDLAAIAELRSAIRHLPPGSSWQMAKINEIASLDSKDMRAPVLEAKLALARMAFEKGDENGAQSALRQLSSLNIKRPILVYTPPFMVEGGQSSPGEMARPMQFETTTKIDVPDNLPSTARRATSTESFGPKTFATNHTPINVEDEWMDVGFRITPEGKVADLKVLRRSGDNGWAPPLLTSIAGRRYTPGKPNDPSSTRVERYTYTSGLEQGATTRVAVHSPRARIEYFDLSPMGIASPD